MSPEELQKHIADALTKAHGRKVEVQLVNLDPGHKMTEDEQRILAAEAIEGISDQMAGEDELEDFDEAINKLAHEHARNSVRMVKQLADCMNAYDADPTSLNALALQRALWDSRDVLMTAMLRGAQMHNEAMGVMREALTQIEKPGPGVGSLLLQLSNGAAKLKLFLDQHDSGLTKD